MHFGGSIRINPCGLLVLGILALCLMYYAFGGGSSSDKAVFKPHSGETISIKALLAASIDVAKKGGHQVKMIREQVRPGHHHHLNAIKTISFRNRLI